MAGLRPCAGAAAVFSFLLPILYVIILLLSSATTSRAATPPRTVISNIAAASYAVGASPGLVSVVSNGVSLSTVPARTPARIEFLQYAPNSPVTQIVRIAPTEYRTGANGAFTRLAAPVPAGSTDTIDLGRPVPLVPAALYHAGEPIFLRLTDLDQNWDPAAAETVVVTIRDDKSGDEETLRLTETGPDTGMFTGYIQSISPVAQPVQAGNGFLTVADDSHVKAGYTDLQDGTGASTEALIDPFGRVFSTVNGLPVDGAAVTLVNAGTGEPAAVFGDNGVSAYPSTVTAGGTVRDSSGAVYTFPPGGYRFPFIAPGQYRLKVTPPPPSPGPLYTSPSTVPTDVIQKLSGAPFAIADPGSREEAFIVNAGPAIHIDLPIDQVTGRLYLLKSAGKDIVAQGDFLPYHLTVQNVDANWPVLAVSVSDRLPLGFRYRKGSARLNGTPAADPQASADGRTLTFVIGDLPPGQKADITYVVEVAAGAAVGKATNSAVASGMGGAASNTATATVLVKEELFSLKSFIVGQVFADRCGEEAGRGLEGVRIYLEDGTYTVTDRNGMYHFEGVTPGTHVVQLDTETVPGMYEIMTCEENTRFAGNSISQFVDLQGGALWRADFHVGLKPKITGEAGIELRSSLKKTERADGGPQSRKDRVEYSVPVHAGAVPLRNLRLTVMLPEGAVYEQGSSALNAVPGPDPEVLDTVLTYRLGDVPAGWEGNLRFGALVTTAGKAGDLPARAVLTFDSPEARDQRTPLADNVLNRKTSETRRYIPDIVLHPHFPSLGADLTQGDKIQLDGIIEGLRKISIAHLVVVGHTDSNPIRLRARRLFADNYELSRARARTVGRYLAERLKLSPEQVAYMGMGPDEPVADNGDEKGRAQNRRVEVMVLTEQVVVNAELVNVKDSSGKKTVTVTGLRPGETWAAEPKKGGQDGTQMPDYTGAWLQSATPGCAWLWPNDGYHPPVPSVKIAIKHDPAKRLALLLNGQEVPALNFDGTTRRPDNAVAVSTWRGIHLEEGDNLCEAVEYDENGAETTRIKRVIHYSSPPVKAELVKEQSSLTADGKNPPVIAVRLTDKDGHPAREGVIGEYSIDPPYLSREQAEDLQKSPLNASASDRLKYQVGADGIALIGLRPTGSSGEAVLRFNMAGGEQEVRAWLTPEYRDWILVGLAEGTVGYNVVKGNMETLADSGGEDKYFEEDRLAFYAKGRIKGEWLLTLAYDSRRAADGQQGLYQTIDPNKYYTLYGDATEQRYDAASAKHLYIKLERDQFYALFGDYNTGLTVTELSRYNRNFTGFKSELKTRAFEYNVYLSDTNQAYVRDEIPGDGTSGLYRLSRKNIVLNSETITLETRDRFHSETIVNSQRLVRFLDYSIDYESGAIFFKSPVSSRDENFNPVFIVAEYESFDSSDTSYNYGGRAAARVLNNRVEVGTSYIHEGQAGGSGDLEGVDAKVKLSEQDTLRAESAQTKTDRAGVEADGSAYLMELQHRSEKMEGKAYVREQNAGFGLGQQNGSETGTRKTGADLNYRLSKPWSVGGQVSEEDNLGTGATRDLAEVRGRYATGRYDLFAGLRRAEDNLATGETKRSDQVMSGMRYQVTDRAGVRISHDQSLGGANSNVDYPTRTTVGADYKLNDTATLFADQEWTHGADLNTETSRIGLRASPWTGGSVGQTVEQQTTENGVRLFSTTGLKQTWQITKQWSADAGLDRSTTIHKSDAYAFNANVPPASGASEDFTAVSLGVGYRQEKWSWTARAEQRHSESEDKFGAFAGANGEVKRGVGLAAGLQTFRSHTVNGLVTSNSDLRLALAYRPFETHVTVLDRLDYLVSERHGGDAVSDDSWRVVNNLVTNVKTGDRTQASIQYASKYVQETIDQNDYRGYTDLSGLEGRYDITKKWDVGMRGLVLHSWQAHQEKYGAGASIGFTPGKNMWVSLGYNFTGFKDRDFSKADFTSAGPFVKLRIKFDQVSVREAVKWFSGQ